MPQVAKVTTTDDKGNVHTYMLLPGEDITSFITTNLALEDRTVSVQKSVTFTLVEFIEF